MTKPIKITETVLRDAHQSLLATRMKIDEMLPAMELLNEVGYHSLEVWGGATFDSCIRFLNEDPWERLQIMRKRMPNTKLQMLLRGQNILGYKHYPDDVVREFVKRSVGNGIDIIRTFDALNDLRNVETAIDQTIKEGGHAQGTVVYTISPIHNTALYVDLAKQLYSMGVHSLCIKDMSGLISPYVAFDLVTELKKAIPIPIHLHSHYTSGMASMAYLKAIEAGVDCVDTAISPLAMGTSQPATESIVATLANTPYDTGLDVEKLNKIASHFREVRDKYKLDLLLLTVDTRVLSFQIPGGMLSNLASQLKELGAMEKYEEVLKELPKVRADMGYPPLVTPTSQIIGTQAVLNVVAGERYKMVTNETKNYVKGLYGKPSIPISQEIIKKIIGDDEVVTGRYADLLEPGYQKYKKEIGAYIQKEEDVLSYALFPQVAEKFLKERMANKLGLDNDLLEESKKNSKSDYYPV